MKKSWKILLLILCVVAAALVILLIVADKNKKETVEILIPEGSLSSDFFVSQNTIYQENENLLQSRNLTYAPYSVDVPDAVSGEVSEGVVFSLDEINSLYISEADEENDLKSHILNEFPQTILLGAKPEKCSFEEIKKNSGYINGFKADYVVAAIHISDEKSEAEAFFVGYLLYMPQWHQTLIVAVNSKVLSTQSLSDAERYAVAVINTLRYLPGEEEKVMLRRPVILEEPSEVLEQPSEEESEEESEEIPKVPSNAIVQIEEITIERDYLNLTIEYSWENEDTMIEARLYSGGTKFSPTRYERGKAIFEIGVFTAGSYQMEIKGYDYGKTHAEFIGQ